MVPMMVSLLLCAAGSACAWRAKKVTYLPLKCAFLSFYQLMYAISFLLVYRVISPILAEMSTGLAHGLKFLVAITVAMALYFTIGYILYGFLAYFGKEDLIKNFKIR